VDSLRIVCALKGVSQMFISDPPSRGKDAVKIAVGFVSVKLAEVAAFGEGLPESFFDYGEVPEANRDELHQLTAGIKNATRRHLAVLVEIGERLLRAKEIAGHGNFLPWLAAEFSWSERTARMYMRVAEFFQGKTATFADLDLTTATALIKAPVEVRDEIMARADAGEVINKAEVKATLAARADHQPKSAANVLRVETTSRRLVVSTVRYVRDPDSAPVDPVTITPPEEPFLTVEASADISRKHLQTILGLLPLLSTQDFDTLYNIVVGERPVRALH
jgi:Protein of unknown function (DUF3102)